jgi:hypothetical protein
MSFLADKELRPLNLPEAQGVKPIGLGLGKGPNALAIAVCEAATAPTSTTLRGVWKTRLSGRATPLLLDTSATC